MKSKSKTKANTQTKTLWGHEVKPSRYPGVFINVKGGCVVRARVKVPTSGKLREIKRVMPQATEAEASVWLEQAKRDVQNPKPESAEPEAKAPRTPPFASYAVSVLKTKTARGELTRENQDRWKHALTHLIQGTYAVDDEEHQREPAVPGFGETPLAEIRVATVERWKTEVCKLVRAADYSPWTTNGWLSILKVILAEGRREFELTHNATEGVKRFDMSEHEVHTEEDPNALNREQVVEFLRLVRSVYPQHYAMTVLGFATGLRGTNLSAIRIKGPTPDLNLDTGVCRVRQSAGRLGGVRNTTKQVRRYPITLPESVLTVLRWHADTQRKSGAPRDSVYLFPNDKGMPRIATVLRKAFEAVCEHMGLPFKLTPHGMRRSYNDMCLAAGVNNLVTRSISGHLTERMQEEYTTVWAPLQRRAIDSVMTMMTGKAARQLRKVG